jgi:hypothetical protein
MTILLLCSRVIFSELCNIMPVIPEECLYSFMVYKKRLPRWILGLRGSEDGGDLIVRDFMTCIVLNCSLGHHVWSTGIGGACCTFGEMAGTQKTD